MQDNRVIIYTEACKQIQVNPFQQLIPISKAWLFFPFAKDTWFKWIKNGESPIEVIRCSLRTRTGKNKIRLCFRREDIIEKLNNLKFMNDATS